MTRAYVRGMTRQLSSNRTSNGQTRRDETELIAALCAEDPEVLGRVYLEHRHTVLRVVGRMTIDPSVAEDLTQETFLMLPQALRGFRGGCSLRTFVTSIAVNMARHHTRNLIRRRNAIARIAEVPDLKLVSSPEQLLAQRELGDAISQALSRLSEEKQVTFLLRELEEHSSQETAQLTRVPEATVRTRVHHAKRLLRDCLSGAGYESAA